MDLLLKVLYFGPPLLMAVILHEVAHGWAAEKLGDPTARRLGRITLNPISHIDPMLTIIVPAMLIAVGSPFIFGGAKPVPVNPMNFKNPRRDMAKVAIAGPLTNFALVAILWTLFELFGSLIPHAELPLWSVRILGYWLIHGIMINLVLGLFNLFPVPPLDGGRIAVGFLPVSLAKPIARLEPFGLLIVVLMLATGIVGSVLGPILEYFAQRMFG
jgi:Zn-dependent protease